MAVRSAAPEERMAVALPEDIRNLLIPPPSLAPGVRDPYEAPAADIVRPAGELDDPLVHLLGIPFDITILGRRGAKEGPAGVRRGFLTCLTYEPGLDIDLATSRGIADVGDVDVLHTNVEGTWDRVSAVVSALVGSGTPLVCIGGDHGLAFPILRGVSQALPGKRIGVISVDAHFDVRITHHGEPSSGVPFRWIIDRHPEAFSGRNLVEFGLAGWLNTKVYHDWLVEQGAKLMTLREIRRRPWDDVVREAFDHAADGADAIWMTFDIDAIEGSTATATNVPAIGGLSPFQAQDLVHAFAQHPKAIGLDIMEVSPPLSSTGLTERQAASLVLDFAAGRHLLGGSRADRS
jgi:formimidoylglutamase